MIMWTFSETKWLNFIWITWYSKSSPINSTHYAKLYPQNGVCIVTIDSVMSIHLMHTLFRFLSWSMLAYSCSSFSAVSGEMHVPSVLWHCWLGIRKSIQPVKIEWWGVGVVICLERGADCLHMVQLMSLRPKTPSSLASFRSRLV